MSPRSHNKTLDSTSNVLQKQSKQPIAGFSKLSQTNNKTSSTTKTKAKRTRVVHSWDGCASPSTILEDPTSELNRPHLFLPKFSTRVCNISPSASHLASEPNLGNFSTDIAKQVENAFHMEDTENVALSLSCVSRDNKAEEAPAKQRNADNDSNKGSSLRRKLRTFTGSSLRTLSGADRRSWQTQSSSTSPGELSRSFRSDSVTTQGTSLTGASTIGTPNSNTSLKATKSHNTGSRSVVSAPAQPKVLKFVRSPGDYVFLDLDFTSESHAMNRASNKGLLPRTRNTAHQFSSKQHPRRDKNQFDKNDSDTAKSSFQKKVEYIRRITGSDIKLKPRENSESERKVHDARKWETKNLICISCLGGCPLCDTTCCIYEAACRKVANADPGSSQFRKASRIMKTIQSLGSRVKDMSTFSRCTIYGGCGRYVCPDCCGVCPVEGCCDIQCKECKTHPWSSCDWHED